RGALGQFFMDAMMGLVAVRSCGAERAVQREHEGLLVEWAIASRAFARTAVAIDGAQLLIGFGLSLWLVARSLGRGEKAGGALLLGYWALRLPSLGQEVALILRRYPVVRSRMLRLLEPLGAPEEIASASFGGAGEPSPAPSPDARGVALEFRD